MRRLTSSVHSELAARQTKRILSKTSNVSSSAHRQTSQASHLPQGATKRRSLACSPEKRKASASSENCGGSASARVAPLSATKREATSVIAPAFVEPSRANRGPAPPVCAPRRVRSSYWRCFIWCGRLGGGGVTTKREERHAPPP